MFRLSLSIWIKGVIKYIPLREMPHRPLCLVCQMVEYMCSVYTLQTNYWCVLSNKINTIFFCFSARAAELSRAHCRFPGGEFGVRGQHSLLSPHHIQWIQIFFNQSSSFPTRSVSWKPAETHQGSGDDGPSVTKRQKPSPGAIIVIKDEPDDDISYVSRKIRFLTWLLSK